MESSAVGVHNADTTMSETAPGAADAADAIIIGATSTATAATTTGSTLYCSTLVLILLIIEDSCVVCHACAV